MRKQNVWKRIMIGGLLAICNSYLVFGEGSNYKMNVFSLNQGGKIRVSPKYALSDSLGQGIGGGAQQGTNKQILGGFIQSAYPEGQIAVSSTPTGAWVYRDNFYRGTVTPVTLTNVLVGTHTVGAFKVGYNYWSQDVYVNEAQTTNVSATLSPATTFLVINPSSISVGTDTEFIVNVDLRGVPEFTSCQFSLSFDPTALQVQRIMQGPFPSEGTAVSEYDNTTGTIDYAVMILGTPTPSGTGTVMSVIFKTSPDVCNTNLTFRMIDEEGYILGLIYNYQQLIGFGVVECEVQIGQLTGKLDGYVRFSPSRKNGHAGIEVYISELGVGTVTDRMGYFSLPYVTGGRTYGTVSTYAPGASPIAWTNVPVVNGTTNTIMGSITLYNGDASGNFVIDGADFSSYFRPAFGKRSSNPGWYDTGTHTRDGYINADFSGDGTIDGLDFSAHFLTNFGKRPKKTEPGTTTQSSLGIQGDMMDTLTGGVSASGTPYVDPGVVNEGSNSGSNKGPLDVTELKISPQQKYVTEGETFDLALELLNVGSFTSVDALIGLDTSKIEVIGAIDGRFPTSRAYTFFDPIYAEGIVYYAVGINSAQSGSGVLATFTLKAKSVGTTALTFLFGEYNTQIYNFVQEVTFTPKDGFVQVNEAPFVGGTVTGVVTYTGQQIGTIAVYAVLATPERTLSTVVTISSAGSYTLNFGTPGTYYIEAFVDSAPPYMEPPRLGVEPFGLYRDMYNFDIASITLSKGTPSYTGINFSLYDPATVTFTKTVEKTQYLPGEYATYTISYSRGISGYGYDFVIWDYLPKGFIYATSTPEGIYNSGSHTVYWEGDFWENPEAEGTYTIVIYIPQTAILGSYINTGIFGREEGGGEDIRRIAIATATVTVQVYDPYPPSVAQIITPGSNTLLSGTITVEAKVCDMETGVDQTKFYWGTMTIYTNGFNVDAGVIKTRTATWKTAEFPDGTDNLYCVAIDFAGNRATSTLPYPVTVDNTSPATPTLVSVTNPAADGKLNLTWMVPGTDTTLIGYKIYYGIKSGIYTQVVDTGSISTNHQLTGLTNGTTYYIAVSAYDNAGNESVKSNEQSGIPTGPLTNIQIEDETGEPIGIKNLTTDETLSLYLHGYDAGWNRIGDVIGTWTVTDGIGGCDPEYGTATNFNPTTVGTGTIKATDGVLEDVTDIITVTAGTVTEVTIVSGDSQTEVVGTTLEPFIVKVTDAKGNPVANHTIQWTVISAPSAPALSATSTTNEAGTTSITMTLGTATGTYSVKASGSKAATFTAYAIPDVGVEIIISPSNPLIIVGGSETFSATLYDQYGNKVGDPAFNWALDGDIGTIDPTSGPSKIVVFTAGISTAGFATLSATIDVVTGITTIWVVFGNLVSVAITPASGEVELLGTQVFTAQAYAEGGFPMPTGVTYTWWLSPINIGNVNPTEGQQVEFSAQNLGTGSINVMATFGSQTVTAEGVIDVIKGIPTTLEKISGDGQTGVVAQSLSAPLEVRVLNSHGAPISGATINWAIISPTYGATLFATSTTTGNGGTTSTKLTLGTKTGEYQVTAEINGLVATFTATAIASSATIKKVSGDNQTGVVGNPLAEPCVVLVADAYGNPISNYVVYWRLLGSPTYNAVLPATSITSDTGTSGVILTLGTKMGSYRVVGGTETDYVLFNATATAGAAAQFVMVSGDEQTGTVATTLQAPFVVRVIDIYGNLIFGHPVNWAITQGGDNASISTASTTTDTNGEARTTLTLGTRAGTYQVEASSSGFDSIIFTASATVGVATDLVKISGDSQRGTVGTTLEQPFVVKVIDVYGNPVANHTVQWTVVSPVPAPPIFSATFTITGNDGTTFATMTFGTAVGNYYIRASGSKEVEFCAMATSDVPDHITILPANSIVIVGQSQEFTAVLHDQYGNKVGTVTPDFDWTLEDDDIGTIDPTRGTYTIFTAAISTVGSAVLSADTQGFTGSTIIQVIFGTLTSVIITPASAEVELLGTQAFTAQAYAEGGFEMPANVMTYTWGIRGIPPQAGSGILDSTTGQQVVFTANGLGKMVIGVMAQFVGQFGTQTKIDRGVIFVINGIPTTLEKISGDEQTGVVAQSLPEPLEVQVLNSHGAPISGATINWAIVPPKNGAVLSAVSTITDDDGIASTRLTLGTKTGEYQVTAEINGLVATFTATAIASSATIKKVSGDNQIGVVGNQLAEPCVVLVADAYGNPISNYVVYWRLLGLPTYAAAIPPTSTTSDTGTSGVILTLGTKTGSYRVVGGTKTDYVLFNATATAGAADQFVMVSGNEQTGTVATTLQAPFVVRATDNYGNPISGYPVNWAITQGGDNASISVTSTTTDNNGEARTTLTLGTKTGRYEVAASSTVGIVTFTATAIISGLLRIILNDTNEIGTQTAMVPFPITITLQDIYGNIPTGTYTYIIKDLTGTILPQTVIDVPGSITINGTITQSRNGGTDTITVSCPIERIWVTSNVFRVLINKDEGGTIREGGTIIDVPRGIFDMIIHILPRPDLFESRAVVFPNGILKIAGSFYTIIMKDEFGNEVHDLGTATITITISYSDVNQDGIVDDTWIQEKDLKIYHYDDTSTTWVGVLSIVDSGANTITAEISKLSDFGVGGFVSAASTLGDVIVWPNPCRVYKGDIVIHFGGSNDASRNLVKDCTIKIYNIAGELIWNKELINTDGECEWNLTNNSNKKVSSGIYLYIITAPDGKKDTGKIGIIR